MLGFSPPCYTNVHFPFTSAPLLAAPAVPRCNPTGVYRAQFVVPPEWLGAGSRRVRLIFQAAGPAIMVWVNGEYVGYSQDSMTAAEFDITDALWGHKRGGTDTSAGSSSYGSPRDAAGVSSVAPLLSDQHPQDDRAHTLVAMVPTWCDGSYLEDQDQWWLTGIHRAVELVCLPAACSIADYVVVAAHRPTRTGLLTVSVRLSAPAPAATSIRFCLHTHGGLDAGRLLQEWSAEVPEGGCDHVGQMLEIADVELWSAEEPILYALTIELQAGGAVLQAECTLVGFRTVAISDGQLCVNGRPLVVAGANVHELRPERGKAITEEDMLEDVRLLKQGNFNAVRNSHYPHHPRWYELCDEHGLYVVDEANIETHGFLENLVISMPACEPTFRAQFLHRTQNMFHRAKNHACVIVWSLGNESGWGPNFAACAAWLSDSDGQRRPVQYEGGERHGDAVFFFGDGQEPTSSIICPMYWSPAMIYPLPSERPVILCEYTHAMGNSNGSLNLYWDLFWSTEPEHKGLQGGFVWEWADGALRVPRRPLGGAREEKGGLTKECYFLDGELGYGGDFGPESGSADAHFVADGLLFPDRSPHPGYYECKRLQQPLTFTVRQTSMDQVTLVVGNRYTFRSLSHLELFWYTRDASGASTRIVSEGPLAEVLPGSEKVFQLRVVLPGDGLSACGQWLFVEARSRADAALVPKGHIIAQAAFTLFIPHPIGEGDPAQMIAPCAATPLRGPSLEGLAVMRQLEGSEEARVTAPGYVARVSRGRLCGLSGVDGRELLASPGLSHCFYRAATDNDRCGFDFFAPFVMNIPLVPRILWKLDNLSLAAQWHMVGLDKLQPQAELCEWEAGAEGPVLRLVEVFMPRRGRACFRATTRYAFGAEDVVIDCHVEALGRARGLTTLPRVGVMFAASPSLSRLAWLGCGPGESYPDRKAAADFAVHCGDVDAQHVDYVVPQENGGKADVRWAALTDPEAGGAGLLMRYACEQAPPPREQACDGPKNARPAGTNGAQVSVSRWTVAELDAARHSHELPGKGGGRRVRGDPPPAERPVQVHIDTAHAGCGGMGEGGAKLWATAQQSMVDPRQGPWSYSVHLRPITSDTWAHNGSIC